MTFGFGGLGHYILKPLQHAQSPWEAVLPGEGGCGAFEGLGFMRTQDGREAGADGVQHKTHGHRPDVQRKDTQRPEQRQPILL